MKKLFFILSAALILFGCGMSDTNPEMGKSVDELVSEGSDAFMAGEYEKAVQAYTDLKDWYPFSKYAILAELKIADSYFKLESYDEAIMAYEEFERMHPKNEAIPYVIYQIGMSWFNQIRTVDRESTPAQKSLAVFKRLNSQYPNSEYASKTGEKIKACMENMAGHELYVANWYLKTQKYQAALNRYEYLVASFPGSKQSQLAQTKIPECRAKIKKQGDSGAKKSLLY